jgi:hypothetical protein
MCSSLFLENVDTARAPGKGHSPDVLARQGAGKNGAAPVAYLEGQGPVESITNPSSPQT